METWKCQAENWDFWLVLEYFQLEKMSPPNCPPAKPWWKLHPPSEEELGTLIVKQDVLVLIYDQLYNYFPAFTSSAYSLSLSTRLSLGLWFLPNALVITGARSYEQKWFGLTKCPCTSTNHHHKFAGLAFSVQQLPHALPLLHGSFQPAQYRTDWNRTLITRQWFWWGEETLLWLLHMTAPVYLRAHGVTLQFNVE